MAGIALARCAGAHVGQPCRNSGSSLSLLGLAGFGGFALLTFALALLGLGDLFSVVSSTRRWLSPT